MRTILLAVLVVAVFGGWLSAAFALRITMGDSPDPDGEATTTAGERASPKELLIGTWKRTIAIDKAQLEGYLKRGGGLKGAASREELLAELKKIVSEETIMEFHADGVMLETIKRGDAKPRTLRYEWNLSGGRLESLPVKLAHTATKGRDKVTVVYRPTISFQGKDRFTMRDQRYERMPLTTPVWDRVRASLGPGPNPRSPDVKPTQKQ
jgi:hypothetical protein